MFPAHAGMNRLSLPALAFLGDVPRARGDEPAGFAVMGGALECSPRTRG